MSKGKNSKMKMPEQPPLERRENFSEVELGYSEEMALSEASRCLQCKNAPCVRGCPVNVKIPQFINLISEKKHEEACGKILETNSLPSVCGRVCPQENQCEKLCVRGLKGEPVAVGRLERFCADYSMEKGNKATKYSQTKSEPVAIIGSGPASLACAGDLAAMGYKVTIFEAFHIPGGVLTYGIPEFRLPKKIVEYEIHRLESSGVEIKTNMVIGKVFTIEELFEKGYKAVFIGSGAGLPNFLNIPGENLNGVYSANEFLTRINLMKAYKFPEYDTPVKIGEKVAVVGAGNVAMDAARSALRLGAKEVSVIYRRSEKEMPARHEEVVHAKEEGIIFRFLTNPKRIIGDDQWMVKGLECVKMELVEDEGSERRRPVEIIGSEHIIDVDTVIIAAGQTPNPLLTTAVPGLQTSPKGGIAVDKETGMTSIPGVFAGGDAVTGAATVIMAMSAGKIAAKAIDEYLGK